jgi:hypothetical protein
MEQARKVEMAKTNAERERRAKRYGIKGIPVLSCISSISFPSSFPFDFMHLIWENLIPNLIEFWTGTFKDLDHEDKEYVIGPKAWAEVGAATAACGSTNSIGVWGSSTQHCNKSVPNECRDVRQLDVTYRSDCATQKVHKTSIL